jgi:hypothetical protein
MTKVASQLSKRADLEVEVSIVQWISSICSSVVALEDGKFAFYFKTKNPESV